MVIDKIGRVLSLKNFVGMTVLTIILLAGDAHASTLTVDDSGGAMFTKIQDAINNAGDGDRILVYSGTYYENVNVNKQLTLLGIDNGGGMPTVNANGANSGITLSRDNSTLEGFKVVNATGMWGRDGIHVNSSNNSIRYNIVSNNNDGISLWGSNNNVLSSNTITGSTYIGIYMWGSSNNLLNGNYILNNSYGIFTNSSNNNTLSSNSVSDNFIGISLYSSSNNILYQNNLTNNINASAYDININQWDSGTVGNHYSNYDEPGEGCVDEDYNSICDSPYYIPGGASVDRYPLTSSGAPVPNDTVLPSGVTKLTNTSYGWNYISWTWTDPVDINYSHVMIYLDGSFRTNISRGIQHYNATGLAPDTEYTIATRTVDINGNINQTWVNHTARTAQSPDRIPPASITNLQNISYLQNYIFWTWNDPSDIDFDSVEIYIDGSFRGNISKGGQSYNESGFAPDTEHTIATKTVDINGNVNQTWVNHTARTAPAPDITPPGSITNLKNISFARNYINWTWSDPADSDFSKVMVYLNGIFKTNVSKGVQYYTATGLRSNTLYTISTHTVDKSGNINHTWINHTARTARWIK